MKCAVIFFLALVVSMTITPSFEASGYSFIGVTDNGVKFPILLEGGSESGEGGTGDGTAVLDALRVSLAIHNIITDGMVYFGHGITGLQTDIRPYVGVNPNDDWVVAISNDDPKIILSVPEFAKEYRYDGNSLVDVTPDTPNILGYTISQSISGSNVIGLTHDGITLSGDGTRIIKLNSYNDILIRGTLNNADVKIVTSPLDLTTVDVSGNNYVLYRNTSPSVSLTNTVGTYHQNVCRGGCIGGHYSYEYYHSVTSSPNLLVASDSDLSSSWNYNLVYHTTASCGSKINRYCTYSVAHSNVGSESAVISSRVTADGLLITSLKSTYVDNSLTTGAHSGSGTRIHTLTSTAPWNEQYHFTTNFEQLISLPTNSYMVVTLHGGSATIKGESFDPDSDTFFKVNNLPADMAFDVSKSGITGVLGKTGSDGVITLLYDDVNFGIPTSPGGILKIYPESVSYLGNLGAALIDMYNKNSVPLPTGDDLVYIPQNYVRWIFPVAVEVTNVRVDNIPLNYLNGNYTKNDALVIPVIPSADTIYATINGTDTEVLMRDVSVHTQIKQVLKKSSSISDHSTSGTASASSNISTSTFLTATHTGTAIANIDIKVGGSADYSMNSRYSGEFTESTSCKWSGVSSSHRTYSCSVHSTPSNPDSISNIDSLTSAHKSQLVASLNNGQASNLTVKVDIFKNLEYFKTVLIYTSNSAQASIASTLSDAGYGATNKVHVTYPLTSISDNIAIPVSVGDMIEYVIRVNLEAKGAPVPTSSDGSYSSYVKVTTEFGGGVITVGMS